MANSLMVRTPSKPEQSPATSGVAQASGIPVASGAPRGVELRPLQQADLDAAGRGYHLSHLGTESEMTPDEALADVQASWDDEYGTLLHEASLGAWQGEELVGCILTVRDAPWDDAPRGPFIIDLFVVPEARRRGIARALVSEALAQLSEPVALRVDDSATAAYALYLDLGFEVVD